MKKKKNIFFIVILFVILAYSINSYAILFNLEVSGENVVTINDIIQLKAEYLVGNDLYDENLPNGGIGEISKEDVTNKVSWISDNLNIATVDTNGKVTGVSEGIVKITAQYNGITNSSHMIKVVKPPETTDTIISTNESISKAEISPKTRIRTLLIVMFFIAIIIIVEGINIKYKNS